jgi:hypothetical protein
VESKEKYPIEVLNRFAALEGLNTGVDSNNAWEAIRENIKVSANKSLCYYILKKHRP